MKKVIVKEFDGVLKAAFIESFRVIGGYIMDEDDVVWTIWSVELKEIIDALGDTSNGKCVFKGRKLEVVNRFLSINIGRHNHLI